MSRRRLGGVDVPRLLAEARARAGFSKSALAARADTSVAALVAYEAGRRSPTVRTLDRLLAACDLQVRAVLEPYLADLDAQVDRLLQGRPELPHGWQRIAEAFTSEGLTWAFDGSTALALHGLSAKPTMPEVMLAADDTTRRFLHRHNVGAVDRTGRAFFESWLSLDLECAFVSPTFTRYGIYEARLTERPPSPVHVEVEGVRCPVLGLLDVEAAHPQLADVLARLRHRRTVGP